MDIQTPTDITFIQIFPQVMFFSILVLLLLLMSLRKWTSLKIHALLWGLLFVVIFVGTTLTIGYLKIQDCYCVFRIGKGYFFKKDILRLNPINPGYWLSG